jgi:hypothetical protein
MTGPNLIFPSQNLDDEPGDELTEEEIERIEEAELYNLELNGRTFHDREK